MMQRALLALACALLAAAAARAQFVAPTEHRVTMKASTFTGGLSDMTAVTVGDKIFLFGGCRQQTSLYGVCSGITNEAFFYYPAEDRLEEISGSGIDPMPRFRHAAALGANGLVYIMGGISAQDPSNNLTLETLPTEIHVFDTVNLEWSNATATLPLGLKDGTAFGLDGKVYFTAGWDYNYSTSADTYQLSGPSDPLVVIQGHDMPRGDAGSAVVGDRAFVLGGYASDAHLNTVEIFDALTLDWEISTSTMRLARGDKAVASMGASIFVFGGQSLENPTAEGESSIEIFDVGSLEWHHGGRMPDARFRFAAASVGDAIYCFGGQVQPTDDSSFALVGSIFAFEESTTGLYSNPTITLHGSGTTNPSNFFWHVMDTFHASIRLPVKMSYRAVGSGTGQKEFLGNVASAYLPLTQFGSGDIPFSGTDYDKITEHYEVGQFPFAFGAVSLYANIPEMREVEGRKLVLPACTLAKIYKGEIKNWKDVAGADADNAWLETVDKPITAVHRVSGSSSTSGLTEYLGSECPEEWGPSLVGSAITWPCDAAGVCEGDEGSGGIQGHLTRETYSLGYLSVSHGYPSQLREATLVNANGDKVQASDAGIQAAADAFADWPDDVFSDFSEVSLINTDGENAWPIVLVSYIYVRKDLTMLGASGALLEAFLKYVLDEEQGQQVMRTYNFVPLTDDLLQLCQDGLLDLDLPDDVESFTFEGSSPLAIEGAGPYVISAKREVYAQQAIEDLQASMTAMELRNTETEAVLEFAATIHEQSALRDDVDATRAIAIAALVIGLLNLLVLCGVLYCLTGVRSAVLRSRAQRRNKGPGETDVELSQQSLDSNNSASAAVRAVNVV